MNGDAFKRAMPGQKLVITAAAWNACLDAAEAHRRRQGPAGAPLPPQFRQADIVLVKNTSGSDVPRFGVLGIAGVIVTPADSLAEFQNQIAVIGTTPAATHSGRFVVCLDPLGPNQLGRAWIAGVCQAQVDVAGDGHQFADVLPGDRSKLQSRASGAARILFRDSAGAGTKWCIVRIGDAGGLLRIGKTSAAWNKGTAATVPLWEAGTPPALTASGTSLTGCINLFADIAANKWVGLLEGPGAPFLIVAEC